MKKIHILLLVGIVGIVAFIVAIMALVVKNEEIYTMSGKIITIGDRALTMQDDKNVIYTFSVKDLYGAKSGDDVIIEYTGELDNNKGTQDVKIVDVKKDENNNSTGIPSNWQDNGIFKQYYTLAYEKVKKLSLEEKIGQILLVRYPGENVIEELKTYNLGGFVFFKNDFNNKTTDEVKTMIKNLQNASKVPLLTAVDEEGGNVIRVSSNSKLVSEPFKSPKDLYELGGFEEIKKDTINKSKILKDLGLNLNLAPVVDVATDKDSYIYDRTIGLDTNGTSTYARTVINASKGTGVSYTLKHFPGYGNASDSHDGVTRIDDEYVDIVNNFYPPFEEGIKAGAESILVSHNIYKNIDDENPASLSPLVHNVLRNDLKFTGIIMTDNLDMGAVTDINDATVKAVIAGNDLIITTDYKGSYNALKNAVSDGTLSEDTISKLAFRVIAWKYYKGLMYDNQK